MTRNANHWVRKVLGVWFALAVLSAFGLMSVRAADRAADRRSDETETSPGTTTETSADERRSTESALDAIAAQEDRNGASSKSTTSPRRQRLNELVSVGSNAEVKANQMADEVVVVGGDATIHGDVRGDVVVVFGKLRLDGNVRGEVVVVLGEAEINGSVGGDTALVMTPGKFGSTAEFDGDVMAVGAAPEIAPGARLKSSPEVFSLGPLMDYFAGAKDYLLQGIVWLRPFPPRVGWVWIAAGAFLVFHLLLAWMLAKPLEGCIETVRVQPARSFLVGLLVCVLVGPVTLLLSFTLIAPLLIWLAFFALCVFGRVTAYGAAGDAIGRSLKLHGLTHPVAAVLAGSLVLYVGYMIPLVGLMLWALALPLGLGAVTLRIFEATRREQRPPAVGAPGARGATAAAALVSGLPGPATHAFAPTSPMATEPLGANPEPSRSAEPTEPVSGPAVSEAPRPSDPVPPSMSPPPVSPPPFGNASVPPRVIPLGGMEALASPRVGFWPRFGASAIDVVLIGAIDAVTFQSAEAFWVLLAVYHGLLWTWRGTTLGGSVLNLRVVRLDGRPIDWTTSCVRILGSVVSLLPLGLGFFWASWDSEFQSWHDRIAGTTVVKPERRVSLV